LTTLVPFGIAFAVLVAANLALGLVADIESGRLVVLQILSPHLAVLCLLLVPVAILARSRSLALALVVVLALFLYRFGSDWISLPSVGTSVGAQGGQALKVATWNLEAWSRPGSDAVAMLAAHPGDVVALEELTPDVAAAIAADPGLRQQYPYQALNPDAGVLGIGILSRYPISAPTYAQFPARLEARLALPDGEMTVLAAHPLPGRVQEEGGIPLNFNPRRRNEDLVLLRSRVDELQQAGSRLLLIGDFNTTPAEPAFERLTAGLRDAHAEVGLGPGWTWRPEPFEFLNTGLIRIDLILTTPSIVPESDSIECPRVGDHCYVEATLRT